ncbi:hypothetical protein [Streptosporangium longisporum]|uniref:Uncharacterized protein n=1 Tax=Streptosporangium longisporum TaxID=46187 RepID=A0ABN3XRM1_9ACTN
MKCQFAAAATEQRTAERIAAADRRAEKSERAAWRAAGEHETERDRAKQAAVEAEERSAAAERASRQITSERDALQGVLDAERRQAAAAVDAYDQQITTLETRLAEHVTVLKQAQADLKAAGSRRAESA